jgi:hypothetical protein
MYIIGAGMAGLIAGIMNGGAKILEASSSLPDNHHGVLRFRSDNISKITGIPFKKVKVRKAVWIDGTEYMTAPPRLANMYSQKVVGKIVERSILNTEPVERWIAPYDFHKQLGEMLKDRIKFQSKVINIDSDWITMETGVYKWERTGLPIISTIPMPALAKVTGLNLSKAALEPEDLRLIYIFTYSIPGANVHQTIYYPDLDLGIYRASLSGDQFIIESIKPELSGFEFSVICQSFGIPNKCYAGNTATPFKELGKFAPIPDVVRKSFMLEASTKLNIWSLGRYACWRPSVLLDDVYFDVLKIRAMIGQHNYNLKLNVL